MTFFTQYIYSTSHPVPTKQPDGLRLDILSNANINSAAVIDAAKTHAGVIVSAVASRNLEQAPRYAKKYKLPKAYASYGDLLKKPGIDAVNISVPNGMHGCTPVFKSYRLVGQYVTERTYLWLGRGKL